MNKSIVFVVNNLNIGGPQKSLLSLLHSFPKEFKVDLIVLNQEVGLEKYLPENVSIIKIPNEFTLLMLNKKKIIKNLLFNMFKNPILVTKASYFLMKNIFNVTLTQEKQKFWINNKNHLKVKKSRNYDYAIAVSGGHSMMHIVDFIDAKVKIGWIRTEYQNLNRNLKIDEEYFKKLDMILSVSNKCSDKFIELFPGQKEKVTTFYNPLPYQMYNNLFGRESEDRIKSVDMIRISTISRLDKDKGFDLVIQAAKLLQQKKYKYKWNIYGIGPIAKEILKEIRLQGLEEVVHLKGFEFNTGRILKKTDILVHPSRFEGKSNTIDEAKYYGIPIVSTNFPTVDEQLKNEFNGIVTEMDGKSLYQGIIRMIENNNLKDEIVRNLAKEQQDNRDIYLEFMSILEKRPVK